MRPLLSGTVPFSFSENSNVIAESHIRAAEIFPTTIRAKGIALAFFSYFLGAITYTTPAPTALRNMCVVSVISS